MPRSATMAGMPGTPSSATEERSMMPTPIGLMSSPATGCHAVVSPDPIQPRRRGLQASAQNLRQQPAGGATILEVLQAVGNKVRHEPACMETDVPEVPEAFPDTEVIHAKASARQCAPCQPCGPTENIQMLAKLIGSEITRREAMRVNIKSNKQLGTTSKGSIGHPHTCAAACRYVKRKGGCRDGLDCTQCHICFWRRRDAKMNVSDETAQTQPEQKSPLLSTDMALCTPSSPVISPSEKSARAAQMPLPSPSMTPPQKQAPMPRLPPTVSSPLQFFTPAPPPGLGFDDAFERSPKTHFASSIHGDDSASSRSGRSEPEFASDASTTIESPSARPKRIAAKKPFAAKQTEIPLDVQLGSYVPGSIFRSMAQL